MLWHRAQVALPSWSISQDQVIEFHRYIAVLRSKAYAWLQLTQCIFAYHTTKMDQPGCVPMRVMLLKFHAQRQLIAVWFEYHNLILTNVYRPSNGVSGGPAISPRSRVNELSTSSTVILHFFAWRTDVDQFWDMSVSFAKDGRKTTGSWTYFAHRTSHIPLRWR